MKRRSAPTSGESGIILVAVLWIVASLALAISAINASVRTNSAVARAELDTARIEALADAGLELAAARIRAKGDEQWIPDGRPYSLNFSGARMTIRVQDSNGLVDLRGTKAELLRAVLDKISRSRSDADRLYEFIIARRQMADPNSAPDVGPAAGQKAANRQQRPAPFVDLSQLAGESGATITDAMTEVMTVHNPGGMINAMTAPPRLLRSLPGLDDAEVNAILEARRSPDALKAAFKALPSALAGSLTQGAKPGPAFRVAVDISHPALANAVRVTTTVLIRQGTEMPFYVLNKQPGNL